jgi:DNA-binding GntR family transcriptional regulator
MLRAPYRKLSPAHLPKYLAEADFKRNAAHEPDFIRLVLGKLLSHTLYGDKSQKLLLTEHEEIVISDTSFYRRNTPPVPPPKPLDGSLGRQYQSLSELVYRRLRDQILWGTIPPGSILSVRKLSERLGVSPMPVRDALRRLATDELVDVAPRSSTRVAQVSPERVKEMFEVRSRLEALAARLAVPHLTSADITSLRKLPDKLDCAAAANRAEEWHRLNQELHRLIFQKCGNSLLQRMTQDLWERNFSHFSGRATTQAKFRHRRSKEHRRIVSGLMRRDPDEVEAAWRDHVWQSGIETVEYLRTLAPKAAAASAEKPPRRLARRD